VQVCVFTAPLFSALCALTTYFLAKEVRNQGAGLFAALFAASVPSYISRSVAGSYDNEGVAIFALVLVFFLYVKVWAGSSLCTCLYAMACTLLIVHETTPQNVAAAQELESCCVVTYCCLGHTRHMTRYEKK